MTLSVRDVVVGTLNAESHGLAVNVPPGMVDRVLEGHPQRRATKDGVSVAVSDADSRTAAEALLRWRMDLERFAWQLGAASP